MSGRKFWRSLEQLADAPETREALAREFPEGAADAPEGVSRRQMLMLMGTSLSIAGLAACRRPVDKIVPYVNAPEDVIPGVPSYYATQMPFGTSSYGIVVESHEGRPSKIEGNTLHPSTRGSSSARIQSELYELYDPDRAGGPRKGGEASDWTAFQNAWIDLRLPLQDDEGASLAVLSEPSSSPTLSRTAAMLKQRYPKMRWVAWQPFSDENPRRGIEQATGEALQAVHHFDRAKVILAIESDFLGDDAENVRHLRGFASGRRIASEENASMNRLWAVESGFSTTGAMADHRKRLKAGRMSELVAALVGAFGLGGAAASPVDEGWLKLAVEDLRAHAGESLVVAGPQLPAAVHAAVAAINDALGNTGRTVTYHRPSDRIEADRDAFAGLVAAMKGGEVSTLVILGGNPAYNAPADLDFAAAMGSVAHVIRLGGRYDETSEAAEWHLPEAHFLERWGDVRAIDGTLGVIQPLIEPLHGGKSALELVALLATDTELKGYDLVRESWTPVLGAVGFEGAWNAVLHDGLLTGTAFEEVTPSFGAVGGLDIGAADGLELVIRPSFALYDGRYANNGWMQELPDPATKLTWDNAAVMSNATARVLGVTDGDVVRVTLGTGTILLPAVVLPGHADESITVSAGYGRSAGGRIADGVGQSVYRLQQSDRPYVAHGVTVNVMGTRKTVATTQDHWSIDEIGTEARDERIPILVRMATLDEYRHDPEFAAEMVEHPPLKSIFTEHDYSEGYQWGMTIDLNLCTSCNACVTACQSENNIPVVGKDQVSRGREMHWIRLDRYFTGDPDDPDQMVFQPVTCMHCENAPCEQVCPVAATTHDSEGLNTMVYNRCIGTRYCSNNCPYKVRRFNYYNFTKDTPELLKLAQNPDVTVRSRGVMEKCTFCLQRINAAKIDAKMDGRTVTDADLQTACQQACPAQAIEFGNVNDPNSRVSKAKAQNRNYEILAELNNKPRTSYLAKIRNPHPALAGEGSKEKAHA